MIFTELTSYLQMYPGRLVWKMKIRVKNEQNKNYQPSFIKKWWIFFELAEHVDGLILK